jgi:hypothetical protein
VEDGAAFGAVDLLAGEHAIAPALDVLLAREREEERQRLVGGAVLRPVDEQAARLAGHAREPLRVVGEQLAHRDGADRRLVSDEGLPGGGAGGGRHQT